MTADPMYSVVYLICNFFTIFIINKFYRIFFEPSEKAKWQIAGAYGLYFVITSILHLTINVPLLTLISNLCCYYVITLIYNASLKKRLSAVAFTYIFMFLMEIIVTMGISNFHFKTMSRAEYVPYLAHVVLKLLSFSFAVAISSFRSVKQQKLPATLQFLSSFIVACISIYLSFVIHNSENIMRMTIIFSISGIFAINILQFTLYDILASVYLKNMEIMLWEQEKNYYQHECEIMKTTQDEMTAFRHDFQNHLAIITQMLEKSDNSDVRNYLSDLKDRTKSKGIYSNSGNLPIDSIINYKLRNAEDLGIQATVHVAVPEILNVEIVDVVTIIGNLLDNAIQAMLKLQQERNLFLKVIFTKGRLIIIVRNTFDGKVNYQNGKIISSKKELDHGHGLKNIENALKRYNGSMKLDHDAMIFSVDAMLYVPQS